MGADRPLSGWEQKAERRDRVADRRERPTDASEIGRFEQATVDRELDASYRQAAAEDRAAAARDRAAAAAMSKRRGRIGRRPQIETHPGGIGWRPPRTGRGRRGSRAGGGRAGPARLRPTPGGPSFRRVQASRSRAQRTAQATAQAAAGLVEQFI
jgi:hypothetical protein